jgi:hypothetical protein
MTRIGPTSVLLAVIAIIAGCSPFQVGRHEPPWADRVTCQRIERQECMRRASELVSRLRNPERIRNLEGIVVSPEVTCLTDQQVPTC